MRSAPVALGLTAALAVAGAARADGPAADRVGAVREAFKPLKLPPAAKVEKDLLPMLPAGIVIEAKPFSDLVARLGKPFDSAFDAREAALDALSSGITIAEADAVKAAWKTVETEAEELSARVTAVEARYAEVYNLEWDASGEKERNTRKEAAVLIPLWRGLLFRETRLQVHAADALKSLASGAPAGLGWCVTTATTDPSPSLRAAAVDALSGAGGAEALAALTKVLASDADPAVRRRALAAFALRKVSEAKDAIVAAVADAAWEVRSLAAAMCARGKIVEAAGALVAQIAKEDGRLRQDLDDALFALVGVRMDGDAALWARWWKENQESVATKAKALAAEGAYDRPIGAVETWEDRDAAVEEAKESKGATTDFYGIRTRSKRVVFVVDISRGMQDEAKENPPGKGGPKDPYASPKGSSKIAIAKWQLHRAIQDLPADATFALLVFSESYKAWLPQMADASPKNKAKAHEFVDGIVANGTTNLCDSLDEAFETAGAAPFLARGKGPRPALFADTIFLLTDGDPNRGRITDSKTLEDDLVRRARALRIVVHAVGIGEVAGSSFLESLAKRTGGRYVGFK